MQRMSTDTMHHERHERHERRFAPQMKRSYVAQSRQGVTASSELQAGRLRYIRCQGSTHFRVRLLPSREQFENLPAKKPFGGNDGHEATAVTPGAIAEMVRGWHGSVGMRTDSMHHEGTKNTTKERENMPNATPLRALRSFLVNGSTQRRKGAKAQRRGAAMGVRVRRTLLRAVRILRGGRFGAGNLPGDLVEDEI